MLEKVHPVLISLQTSQEMASDPVAPDVFRRVGLSDGMPQASELDIKDSVSSFLAGLIDNFLSWRVAQR